MAARAKLHFDPNVSFSDTASLTTAGGGPVMSVEERVRGFKQGLKPLHNLHTKLMYFQVKLCLSIPSFRLTNAC